MAGDLGLSGVEPERLRLAVRRALAEGDARLPRATALRHGAEETQKHDAGDAAASRRFQSLLEVGYLVASADGLADAERHALAVLLEDATERAVDQASFELHFRDLDDACAALGRRERLRRAAEDFEDDVARHEALAFAALVAIADGVLGVPERQALRELGSHLGFSESEVEANAREIIASVKKAVSGGAG